MFKFLFPKEFKNKKVKLYFKENIEPHEIFLDKLAQEKEEELGISERKLEIPLQKRNLQIFLIVYFILIFVFFLRTFQFQIIQGEKFSLLAEGNKFIIYQIKAERGVIYDQKMNQLVYNQPVFDLICEKNKLPRSETERKKNLKKLSQILKLKNGGVEDIEKKIKESQESTFPIFENLEHQTLIMLETKIRELPGFKTIQNSIRNYKDGEKFAHLLGYLTKIRSEELKKDPQFYSLFDYVGREGVEKWYEKTLRKNPGKLRIERDAKGNLVSQEIISLPEVGKSLVLWLDSDLQIKIRKELEKKLKELGIKKASAIAIDPQTGGILAMISLPSFDNNLFSQRMTLEEWQELSNDSLKPLNNRTIIGQYLIGSIIKPLIALAALEEKIISPDKKIDCQGLIEISHHYDPKKSTIFRDWTIHGPTDLKKAIAESCNIYFYNIGGGYKEKKGLGPTRIKKYLQLFDFGEVSKIDFPVPEYASGLVPDPEWKKKEKKEPWWDGDTYHFSIGQGYILATPLQVVTAFSAIANGGKLLQPQVVKAIVDDKKNIIQNFEPKIIRENFVNPKNLEIIREGMKWATTGENSPRASAILLNVLPVSTAAKTGTAQAFRKNCQNCYHIWITVFAPYENPKIVLTLMFEDVKGLTSDLVAVPVAKEILNWYFTSSYLNF